MLAQDRSGQTCASLGVIYAVRCLQAAPEAIYRVFHLAVDTLDASMLEEFFEEDFSPLSKKQRAVGAHALGHQTSPGFASQSTELMPSRVEASFLMLDHLQVPRESDSAAAPGVLSDEDTSEVVSCCICGFTPPVSEGTSQMTRCSGNACACWVCMDCTLVALPLCACHSFEEVPATLRLCCMCSRFVDDGKKIQCSVPGCSCELCWSESPFERHCAGRPAVCACHSDDCELEDRVVLEPPVESSCVGIDLAKKQVSVCLLASPLSDVVGSNQVCVKVTDNAWQQRWEEPEGLIAGYQQNKKEAEAEETLEQAVERKIYEELQERAWAEANAAQVAQEAEDQNERLDIAAEVCHNPGGRAESSRSTLAPHGVAECHRCGLAHRGDCEERPTSWTRARRKRQATKNLTVSKAVVRMSIAAGALAATIDRAEGGGELMKLDSQTGQVFLKCPESYLEIGNWKNVVLYVTPLVALAIYGAVAVYRDLNNCLCGRRYKVMAQDKGVQSQSTFDRKAQRFNWLGARFEDHHSVDASAPYELRRRFRG